MDNPKESPFGFHAGYLDQFADVDLFNSSEFHPACIAAVQDNQPLGMISQDVPGAVAGGLDLRGGCAQPWAFPHSEGGTPRSPPSPRSQRSVDADSPGTPRTPRSSSSRDALALARTFSERCREFLQENVPHAVVSGSVSQLRLKMGATSMELQLRPADCSSYSSNYSMASSSSSGGSSSTPLSTGDPSSLADWLAQCCHRIVQESILPDHTEPAEADYQRDNVLLKIRLSAVTTVTTVTAVPEQAVPPPPSLPAGYFHGLGAVSSAEDVLFNLPSSGVPAFPVGGPSEQMPLAYSMPPPLPIVPLSRLSSHSNEDTATGTASSSWSAIPGVPKRQAQSYSPEEWDQMWPVVRDLYQKHKVGDVARVLADEHGFVVSESMLKHRLSERRVFKQRGR